MQLVPLASCVCLLWIVLVVAIVEADKSTPHQFDYRQQHQEAAARLSGKGIQIDEQTHHEAPRLRERSAKDHPERWSQFVPDTARSVAVEISEARREAAEMERRKSLIERREQEEKEERVAEEARQAQSKKKSKNKNKDSSTMEKVAQNVKSATKKTTKRVQAKAEKILHLDHEEEDDEFDDENDEEEDEDGYSRPQKAKKRKGAAGRVWGALRWVLATSYGGMSWSGRHLVWVPSTYAAEAVRWSAHTSWKTTRWTGERALVGPALTAGAPIIYLLEGFLFLFVWLPARAASIIARELYPIYIFFGAALAVGTAMGLASAVILYIGSFFLSDSSSTEERFSHRAEAIPEELQRRFQQSRKSSTGKRRSRSGSDSIIERAIQESLERSKRRGSQEQGQGAAAAGSTAESDEEDDYFGQANAPPFKGKRRNDSSNNDLSPTGDIRRTPTHFGPPSLPIGATSGQGWTYPRSDSSSSSPAMSPVAIRGHIPNASHSAYTSARSRLTASPLASPDIVRSGSSRLRRNVNASV